MSVISIIIAILIFSFIILFHEFGHFIVAKSVGVKVNEFSLGFGPRIVSFEKGETRYSWKLLPLGGSCAMEGEDEESDDDRAFGKKNVWARIAIVAAGPAANFLLALLVSIVLVGVFGYDPPVVYDVLDGYPAQEAGIEAGDRITEINHHHVFLYREISIHNQMHAGETVDITYEHEGESRTVTLVPKEEDGGYYIGIRGGGRIKGNVFATLKYSYCEMRFQISTCLQSLGALIRGRFTVRDLSGPVGITSTIGQVYEESKPDGPLYIFGNLMMIGVLLSANLGVMNLIPFPALDGGRILMLLVEVFTKRRFPEKIEGAINLVGFTLLMALMVFVMGNDIFKIVKGVM